MSGTPYERESLRQLSKVLSEDFPEPEHQEHIESFLDELSLLMDAKGDAEAPLELTQARETCKATSDNVMTLLYKFEDYLESLLVGRLTRGAEAGRGRR